ncbi:MAG: TolC family protein [Gammaproteobacteria bacterium]|nr:TolC family protein [Gammaproteobacteria bacterium]
MQIQTIVATQLLSRLSILVRPELIAPPNDDPPVSVVRSTVIGIKKFLLFCLFIGWQISFVQAESPRNTLTLDTALKRTIEQNPSLKVFDFRNAALNGQMEIATLKPAYELGLDAENFSGSDELSGFDGAELTVSLSSVLEMGDKRAARQGIVSSSRSVLNAQRQVESLELLGEVTRRYVDVLALQEQVSLAKEANELAGETLNIVKKRAKAGATPDAEVKRAQAAAAQAHLTLLATQQQLDYLKVSLAAFWGDTLPNFASVEGDLYDFGTDVEFNTLFAKIEKNPAIRFFAAEERLRDAEIRIAKTQSKADISWSVGVRRFQANDDSALVAGFSMPLFSSKRNSGAQSTALAQRNEISMQKEVALLSMHTQLFRAFHNRRQAILAAKELQSTIIPALSAALKETQTAYERGRYGYLEYVSARQELLNARRTLIESASSALTYGTEIEQLTAEPISATQYGESTKFSGSVR